MSKFFHSRLLNATCFSVLKYTCNILIKGSMWGIWFFSLQWYIYFLPIMIIQLKMMFSSLLTVSPNIIFVAERLGKACWVHLKLNQSFILCQRLITMLHSWKRWVMVSLCELQKLHLSESVIPIFARNVLVARILCSILYWNHLRCVSSVVLCKVRYALLNLKWSVVIPSLCHFNSAAGDLLFSIKR